MSRTSDLAPWAPPKALKAAHVPSSETDGSKFCIRSWVSFRGFPATTASSVLAATLQAFIVAIKSVKKIRPSGMTVEKSFMPGPVVMAWAGPVIWRVFGSILATKRLTPSIVVPAA